MRRLVASLAVAAALAIPAGIASAHTTSFNTAILIEYVDRAVNDVFRGEVTSAKQKCVENRRVKLFRTFNGNTTVVDTDRSEDNGSWAIDLEQQANGQYFARVAKRVFGGAGHEHICEPASSSTIGIDL